MPKSQATLPHTMMATMAAMSVTSALCASPPKSTMPKMVCATAGEIADMTSKPTKLQIAAMMMARRGFMARVDTAVAMALGASVAPFTMMTPMLSRVTTIKSGLLTSSVMKNDQSIVTACLSTFGHAWDSNIEPSSRRQDPTTGR